MTKRLETGVVRVKGDWPGVFIRGDNAFELSLALRELINLAPTMGT